MRTEDKTTGGSTLRPRAEAIPDPRLHDRADLLPHWAETLPADDRASLLAAWQARRSCADCRHWGDDYDRTHYDMIACGAPGNEVPATSVCTPADDTCSYWEAADAR
jgi:hypothetical protein